MQQIRGDPGAPGGSEGRAVRKGSLSDRPFGSGTTPKGLSLPPNSKWSFLNEGMGLGHSADPETESNEGMRVVEALGKTYASVSRDITGRPSSRVETGAASCQGSARDAVTEAGIWRR